MTAAADLTGLMFGRLKALDKVGCRAGHALWLCECECGQRVEVIATNLKKGNTRSCGCLAIEVAKDRAMDITGQKYGRATVLVMLGIKNHHSHVECLCECGTVFTSTVNQLRMGTTKSCGCLWKESITTHGEHRHPIYKAWVSMIQRCHNPRNPMYSLYGGRGICVHDLWRGRGGFERFRSHMGDKPSPKHSLDRIDNNGHYEPGNVKWATSWEQARNKRTSRLLTANGRTQCLKDWAAELCVSASGICSYIRRGVDFQDVFDHFKSSLQSGVR